ATRRREVVERGRRDDPDLILQRGRDMEREAEGVGRGPASVRDAGRGDVLRPRAVGNLTLPLASDHRRLRRSVLPEGGRCRTQGEAARQGGAVSQELSSSRSFLAHWCSPGRFTPRNRSRLPIVYTHIRPATRMVLSRRSWVSRINLCRWRLARLGPSP